MRILFYCCVIVFIVTGCNKETTNINGNSSDDFPNKIGDRWMYLVNDTAVDRTTNTWVASEYNLTVTIIDRITLPNGVNANVWVYSYPERSDTSYVFQTGDTVHFMNPHYMYGYSRQYIVPFMLYSSWKYTEPALSEVTVIGRASIIVGQNQFENAWHIQGAGGLPDAIFNVDEWAENRIGIVKRYVNQSGELINQIHLTSWSLMSYNLY